MTQRAVTRWSVPDVTFSESQLAVARSVLECDMGGSAQVELAFLGGSLAAGLGHATSDVNLYAVGQAPAGTAAVFRSGGVVVRALALRSCAVHARLQLADAYRMTDAKHPQATASWGDLSALVDMTLGRVLYASPQWRQLMADLRTNAVRELLIARHAADGAAAVSEAFGALISGDLYTAYSVSEMALVSACEAMLCAAGDLYFGRKYLSRRLSRVPMEQQCRDELTRLLNFPWLVADGQDSQAVRRLVDDRLLAANMLLASAVLEGWESDSGQPVHAVPAAGSSGGPRRSPYFAPVRYADGFTLAGPGAAYDVSEPTLRLWRRLDGRPLGELMCVLAKHEPQLAVLGLDDIDQAVQTLRRIGAVESTPSPPGMPQLGAWIEQAPSLRTGALSVACSARLPFFSS